MYQMVRREQKSLLEGLKLIRAVPGAHCTEISGYDTVCISYTQT